MEYGSAYGLIAAKPGHKYEWKVKILDNTDANIGIVEFNENIKWKWGWWCEEYGYSYYRDGFIYNGTDYKKYGDRLGKDDIVGVILDLKENYQLSFSRNGKVFGKAFDMKKGNYI